MTIVFKEAAAALRRTPIVSMMTAIVIAVTLALTGILAMLAAKANDTLEDFRANLVTEAFFDPSLSSENAQNITNEKIKKIDAISSVVFISKEAALADYEKNSHEDVQNILGYNPLPASVRMTFAKLTSAKAEKIKKGLLLVEGIKDVIYDEKSLTALEKRSDTLYLLTLILGGVLLIVSLTVVASTTRLALESRRDAIHAMQLLGARRSTILFPYIIEGAIAGLAGGLLAGGLILLFHFFVIPAVASELTTGISEPKQYFALFGFAGLAGIVVGKIGSLIAAWRVS